MKNFERIGNKIPEKEIWQQLITKWCILMDDYIRRYNIEVVNEGEKDLPYWWETEHSNAGFLCGAAWSLGGSVVEEIGVQRSTEEGKSKGRCDFWFGIGNLRCYIETKQERLGSLTNAIDKIQNKLNEAKKQLNDIENRKGIGIAICFLIPELNINSFNDIGALNETRRIFDEVIKYFKEDNNIVATYFPQGNVHIESDEYYYPGVALIGELII